MKRIINFFKCLLMLLISKRTRNFLSMCIDPGELVDRLTGDLLQIGLEISNMKAIVETQSIISQELLLSLYKAGNLNKEMIRNHAKSLYEKYRELYNDKEENNKFNSNKFYQLQAYTNIIMLYIRMGVIEPDYTNFYEKKTVETL